MNKIESETFAGLRGMVSVVMGLEAAIVWLIELSLSKVLRQLLVVFNSSDG